MEKTLDTFSVGEDGIVKSVIGEGKIKRRLFDMGITPGAEIHMRKRRPSETLSKSRSAATSLLFVKPKPFA